MIFFFLPFLALIAVVIAAVVFAVAFVFIRKPPAGSNRFGVPSRTNGPLGAVGNGFAGYFNFGDRSNRWDFFVFAVVVAGLCVAASVALFIWWNSGAEYSAWEFLLLFVTPLILVVPSLAMAVRRLHDINRSGWWLLLLFGFGYFILLYWFLQPPEKDVAANVF